TYTHETLIQAGRKDIPVASVKVGVNAVLRPSRLFRSIPRYVLRSANTIFRIYLIYDGFRAFALLAAAAALVGVASLALWLADPGALGRAPSLRVALPWV